MIKVKRRERAAQPIDPAKLKAYVERIENVETRITEERDARADIYTEVKASGMKPKMVRKIVKERAKKDEDAAELAELDRYRDALAMPGATYRSVAEKTGIPRSTLHRLVPREKNGTEPPHSPETGEITEPRSSAIAASDSASDSSEPVVPTGNEGRAGERGLDELSSNAGAVFSRDIPAAVAATTEGEDDGRSNSGISERAAGAGSRADDGNGGTVGPAGRQPATPAGYAGPDRAAAEPLRAAADEAGRGHAERGQLSSHVFRAGAGHTGVSPVHGRDDQPGTETAGRPLHAASGHPLAADGQRGVEQASTPPPTESLGAVAPSAGRVATHSDDLAIPMFLRRSA